MTFHVKGKDFQVIAKAEDLYVAIDKMTTIIVRDVTRHHDRTRALRKVGAREVKRRMQEL